MSDRNQFLLDTAPDRVVKLDVRDAAKCLPDEAEKPPLAVGVGETEDVGDEPTDE